jgi:hypothetical protein
MMRRAEELARVDPESVAFLDFEDRDFDQPVVLEPSRPDRTFWTRVLEVALGDVATLVAPDRVVLCEGRFPSAGINPARAEFDARCFRNIFGLEYPQTDFVSVGNSLDVATDHLELGRAIQMLVSGTRVIRVVDRDGRSTHEISDLQSAGTRVLTRRHIESYLLDDEVMDALCHSVGRSDLIGNVIQLRDDAIASSVSRGNDPDDWKSASGQFSTDVRQLLSIRAGGSTREAFLADTLAPLLAPPMNVYRELRSDVFDV